MLSNVGIEPAQVRLRRRSKLNAERQDSISKFAHQLTQRDRSLFLGLLPGGKGVFDVDSVHLRLREALQEVKVLNRNYGNKVLAARGHNGALFAEGGAIHQIGKLVPSFGNIETCHEGAYESYKLYITSMGEKALGPWG